MAKKDEKKSKSESKTPELTKAKKALDAYLKENKLDPTKDWTKDKKHGKKVTELVNKLNKERDKVAAAYPEADQENNKKLVKLQEKEKKEKVKGEVSSFQSLATAIAAQVGTGNLAGVAGAIVSGGPGAASQWQFRSARRVARRVGGVPACPGARMGALRLAQEPYRGAGRGRGQRLGHGPAGGGAAICVSALP